MIDYDSILNRDLGEQVELDFLLNNTSIDDPLGLSFTDRRPEKLSTIIHKRNNQRRKDEKIKLKREEQKKKFDNDVKSLAYETISPAMSYRESSMHGQSAFETVNVN